MNGAMTDEHYRRPLRPASKRARSGSSFITVRMGLIRACSHRRVGSTRGACAPNCSSGRARARERARVVWRRMRHCDCRPPAVTADRNKPRSGKGVRHLPLRRRESIACEPYLIEVGPHALDRSMQCNIWAHGFLLGLSSRRTPESRRLVGSPQYSTFPLSGADHLAGLMISLERGAGRIGVMTIHEAGHHPIALIRGVGRHDIDFFEHAVES
jgi:hypothetical protein